MVSGGAALVAASSVTGLSLAPAWGGLLFGKTFEGISLVQESFEKYAGAGTGAALLGGNMIARNMCLGNRQQRMLGLGTD